MPPVHDDRSQRIEIPSLYQYTGLQTYPDQRPLSRWSNVSSESGPDKYLILLQWSVQLTFLQVKASATIGSQKVEFRSDNDALRRMFTEYGMPESQIPPGLIQTEFEDPTHRFMAAEVPRKLSNLQEPQISTLFTIDTNSEGFKKYGEWRQEQIKAGRSTVGEPLRVNDPFPPCIHVLAYFRDERGGPPVLAAPNKVILDLTPADKMPVYAGFIAIDLGNTNTTLVCMPSDRSDVKSIEVVGGEHGPDDPRETARHWRIASSPSSRGEHGTDDPIETAIRIEEYTEPKKSIGTDRNATRYMAKAEFKIGTEAISTSSQGLVLGAKRLLAAPKDTNETHTVRIGSKTYEIARDLPAELFITGMFRAFQSRKLARPTRIAVTYPTTFSDREISQLRMVVYHAWRRANGFEDYTFKLETFNKLLPPPIDEASAAAMFFIYSDFIRGPGGLPAMRYAYPDGLNLLLYDCGGGTTDIALVRVKLQANDDNHITGLDLEVLGRAGLRNFGGDNITEGVFRVLKAKMACEMATTGARRSGTNARRFPDDPSLISAFLEEHQTEFDKLVPTRFDRKRIDLPENQIRMDVALEFWNWAERVKRQLGGDKEELDLKYVRESKLEGALRNMDSSPRVDMGLKLSRHEVDAIIQESVTKSIRKANHLIQSRLPAGAEVHRVYLVGNASRYPLLQSMLRRDLNVRFLGEPGDQRARLIFDSRNLKHAVAKGAVIAVRLRELNPDVWVRIDNKLSERLPYDIGYDNLGGGGFRLIYRAHELFNELEPTAIAVSPPDPGTAPLRRLSLHRRWPGESEWEQFIDFVFKQPFTGPLMLRHQKNLPDPPYFVLKDEGTKNSGEEVTGVEKSDVEYVSPAQRGDL